MEGNLRIFGAGLDGEVTATQGWVELIVVERRQVGQGRWSNGGEAEAIVAGCPEEA
jgi:hypothetical protein